MATKVIAGSPSLLHADSSIRITSTPGILDVWDGRGGVSEERIERVVKKHAKGAMELSLRSARGAIRVMARNNRRSGRFHGSIQIDGPHEVGNEIVGNVTSNVPHAKWLEEGTGIHGPRRTPIVPRRTTKLKFRPEPGADYVYLAQVPGQRPKRFFERAAIQTRPEAERFARRAARFAAAELRLM